MNLDVVCAQAAAVGADAVPLGREHPGGRVIGSATDTTAQESRAYGERAQRGLRLREEVLRLGHVETRHDDHTWQARPVTTPRRRFEQRIGPLVVLLARLPRIVPFLIVFGLLIGGLLLQGKAGGAVLLVLSALLGGLLFLAWPALPQQARVVRLVVLGVVVLRAVSFLS